MRFFIYFLILSFTHIEVRADILSKLSKHIQKILGSKNFDIKLNHKEKIEGENFKDIKFNEDYSSFNVSIGGKNVSGKIDWKVKIPVLNCLKKPGESISIEEIELKEFNLNAFSKDICIKQEDVISHVSSLVIKPGLPISKKYLKVPYAVKKGDKITIFLKRSNFIIQTQGIASQNGMIGDSILVEPVDSLNKKIKVKVEHEGVCSL